RLGRYILEELTGLTGRAGRVITTAVTAGTPAMFLLWQPVNEHGQIVERWRVFWDLFGASNQLLAALTLIGVTVWLWRTYKARWVLLVTGVPCVFMYTMSMWALVRFVQPLLEGASSARESPVPWVATILSVLGGLILLEAIIVMIKVLPGGR